MAEESEQKVELSNKDEDRVMTLDKEDSTLSLSDDSNLSSTSLIKELIEKSLSEVSSFTNLTFDEKLHKIRKSTATSFLSERKESLTPSIYEKDIKDNMRRTISDRNKTYQEGLLPKYSEERERNRSLSRPDIGSLTIPMMSKLGMIPEEARVPSWKIRRSGYVGELLDYMDSRASSSTPRFSRRRTVQLTLLEKRLKEEEKKPVKNEDLQDDLNEDFYNDEHKEIIEMKLGQVHRRKESVFVPYGKLSYLQGVKGDLSHQVSQGSLLFSPSTEIDATESYDDYYRRSDFTDFYKKFYPSKRNKSQQENSVRWERLPSDASHKTNIKRRSGDDKSKSVRFSITEQ